MAFTWGRRKWPWITAHICGVSRPDWMGCPLPVFLRGNLPVGSTTRRCPAADLEVRGKIAAQAKERVDRETTAQINAAAARLQDEVLGPMDSLLLDPLMVAAETTEKRFSMRIRLAGSDQLGGHTPRPMAPADSLASVQVHESLLNNVLERLELDGETFTLAGLGQRLAQRFHRYQPKPVDPDQEDVKITFAAKDALRVRCNNGGLEITLAIARLSKGRATMEGFPGPRLLSAGGAWPLGRSGPRGHRAVRSARSSAPARSCPAQRLLEGLLAEGTDPRHARGVCRESQFRRRGRDTIGDRRRLDRRGPRPAADGHGTSGRNQAVGGYTPANFRRSAPKAFIRAACAALIAGSSAAAAGGS